jgi:hypothetical protein
MAHLLQLCSQFLLVFLLQLGEWTLKGLSQVLQAVLLLLLIGVLLILLTTSSRCRGDGLLDLSIVRCLAYGFNASKLISRNIPSSLCSWTMHLPVTGCRALLHLCTAQRSGQAAAACRRRPPCRS